MSGRGAIFWISLVIGGLSSNIADSVRASERESTCYKVDDRGPEFLDQSRYILCVFAGDLEKYPKSVVTVVLRETEFSEDSERGPAGSVHSKLFFKRHYTRIDRNKYGRKRDRSHPKLIFDPASRTVFIGFWGKEGKRCYYKILNSKS